MSRVESVIRRRHRATLVDPIFRPAAITVVASGDFLKINSTDFLLINAAGDKLRIN